MGRGRTFNPEHTRLIVRWYGRTGSTRATAAHLRCSRGTVLRHLRHAVYAPSFIMGDAPMTSLEHPYTARAIATFLGYKADNPTGEALLALELIERKQELR